ncbi:MAG: hypothetical protein JW779_12110 [Candidatus Thorarchaeota archaeon]|nr:hypothetical protein [Candidatus Thorarchaeota archaeon]
MEERILFTELCECVASRKQLHDTATWDQISNQLRAIVDIREETKDDEYRHLDSIGKFVRKCTDGIIRDFVMDYFDLRVFDGLDGDILAMFSEINSKNPENEREQALSIAHECLKKQVKRGNTFFLNTCEMSKVIDFLPLVADIIDTRSKEIMKLGENTPVLDVVSTFYGFTIVTYGSIESSDTGISLKAIEEFDHFFPHLNFKSGLICEELRYSNEVFGDISTNTRNLLWNMLQISICQGKDLQGALAELGKGRDARALPLLHLLMTSTRDRGIAQEILKSIQRIKHTSSIAILQECQFLDPDVYFMNKQIQTEIPVIEQIELSERDYLLLTNDTSRAELYLHRIPSQYGIPKTKIVDDLMSRFKEPTRVMDVIYGFQLDSFVTGSIIKQLHQIGCLRTVRVDQAQNEYADWKRGYI